MNYKNVEGVGKMDSKLKETFGYCIIPKGTLLYRGHSDPAPNNCMFFALKFWVAGAFNKSVQIWKTKSEIELLFLVEYVNTRSWTISAIPRLYKSLFPEEGDKDLSDLDIKHFDIEKRNKLINKLFSKYGVSGWFTSLEENIELEVCLFDEFRNNNQLLLLDAQSKSEKNHYKDSLNKMSIFPTTEFYAKTYQVLRSSSPGISDEKSHWKKYRTYINNCIKEESKTKEDIVRNREWWSDLRTRLKI